MSKKGKYQDSFPKNQTVMGEAPIEAAPIAEDITEKPEIKVEESIMGTILDRIAVQEIEQETESPESIKESKEEITEIIEEVAPVLRRTGKVILITRNGCVVQEPDGNNVRLYNRAYMNLSLGEIIEF